LERLGIYRNSELAGWLSKTDDQKYIFEYEENYFQDSNKAAVSLTLPKSQKLYYSDILFPFFYNMLSEGFNRALQSRSLQIDEKDFFELLKATCKYDTIGAITVKPENDENI
jgi:HipA-like protein